LALKFRLGGDEPGGEKRRGHGGPLQVLHPIHRRETDFEGGSSAPSLGRWEARPWRSACVTAVKRLPLRGV
jgi:hypothetical protein